MKIIYFIGGSPCAGKSTVAEILSKKYNLYYFKVDERLDAHTKLGASKDYPICKKTEESSWEQIWMRRDMLLGKEVQKQCQEIGYASILNDGDLSVDELTAIVEKHFGLEELC